MASPKADGRMIRKDISESDKFAALSAEAAVLFAMLIPHFNPFGKLNGGPGYIKEIVCPKIPYLTVEKLPLLLAEISEKTNVKWFQFDSRYWIHSLSFLSEHQTIDTKKLGKDKLPDYSGTTRGLVPEKSPDEPECEPEPERKREREGARATSETEEPSEPESVELDALAQHSFDLLCSTVPKRDGRHLDLDTCREKYRRMRPAWKSLQDAAVVLAGTRDAQEGFACSLLKFLSGRYQDYLRPAEELSGAGPPAIDKSALEEIARDREEVDRGPRVVPIRPAFMQQNQNRDWRP